MRVGLADDSWCRAGVCSATGVRHRRARGWRKALLSLSLPMDQLDQDAECCQPANGRKRPSQKRKLPAQETEGASCSREPQQDHDKRRMRGAPKRPRKCEPPIESSHGVVFLDAHEPTTLSRGPTPELRRTAARPDGVVCDTAQAEPRSSLGLNDLSGNDSLLNEGAKLG